LLDAGHTVRGLIWANDRRSEKLAGLPVEIEYEDGFISQFPVVSIGAGDAVDVHLGTKHTDCLAKDVCLPSATPTSERCSPGSGCC